MGETIQTVALDQIRPNVEQPRAREHFDDISLNELAKSIKRVGLLQPPLVQKLGDHFEIIAGERRYRAAKIAGLKEIPVIIKEVGGLEASLAALIENLQREDLNPIDTALAMKKMASDFDLNQSELASSLGIPRTSLSNQMRLLSLPPLIQKALIEKKISQGHAKVILSKATEKERLSLFQVIVGRNLSVREAEEKAASQKKKLVEKKTSTPLSKNIFLQQIQESLQERLGTKVVFSGDEKGGVLSFHYYNLSDLNRLLTELGYSEDG